MNPPGALDFAQKHENPANRPGLIPQNLFPFALYGSIIAHFYYFRTPQCDVGIKFVFLQLICRIAPLGY